MGDKKFSILIVDDEKDVREFLSYNIVKEGYKAYTAKDGKEAIEIAREKTPHLIILDVMMPRMDGIETCEELRKIPSLKNSIIIFLTARGEDYSQIAGFEAGADDYVSKPIKPKVLISRIKALLRRYKEDKKNAGNKEMIKTGSLSIDKEKYLVFKGEEEIVLPKKQFEILYLLAANPNKVFTRDEIFNMIWGKDVIVGERTIDVHIRKIREKTGLKCIKTIKGVGYRFYDTEE